MKKRKTTRYACGIINKSIKVPYGQNSKKLTKINGTMSITKITTYLQISTLKWRY